MQLVQGKSWENNHYLAVIKTFLIWSFTLTVCLLVVGFPVVVLMATIGSLLAVILHSVLPISSVLLVAGIIIGANVLSIMMGSVILTAKGINPESLSWLSWLHGQAEPIHTPIYASCPLTCGLTAK